MHRIDLISGVVTFVFGLVLYFLIIPSGIEVGEATGGLSPRFFPNLSALIIIFLGALLFLVNLRSLSPSESSEEKEHLTWSNTANIILLTALSFGGIAMFKYLGYLITAPLLVGAFMIIYGGFKRWRRILLTSFIGPYFLYAFVWGVFGTPLP